VNEHDVDQPCPLCGLRSESGCTCSAALDDCDRCSLPWHACLCDPSRPNRQPTAGEIEEAREQRLARAERGRGIG
jgi:hypothetical protein